MALAMSTYNDGNNVLVRFERYIHQTEKAILVDLDDAEEVWFAKSQVAHFDEDGKELWIPRWLAEEKGVSYE